MRQLIMYIQKNKKFPCSTMYTFSGKILREKTTYVIRGSFVDKDSQKNVREIVFIDFKIKSPIIVDTKSACSDKAGNFEFIG